MFLYSYPYADPFLLALAALLVDALIGDPRWLYARFAHPVAVLGGLVESGTRALNCAGISDRARRLRGAALAFALLITAALAGAAVHALCTLFAGGWIVEAVLASTLIAFRGLHDHVRAVARGLRSGPGAARRAVAHIVGRDPDALDEAGVARAAVESTAENFSDGVVAPLFWFALLGLGGLCAYKAVKTLDSMIGHRDTRFEHFGKFAARLDDAINWIPARLCGALFVLAALAVRGASARSAWLVMLRDAPGHRSVNAGWQEAAVAGALGFALAGPRRYGAHTVDDHWMGHGRRDLGARDVEAALDLYARAGVLAGCLLGALSLMR